MTDLKAAVEGHDGIYVVRARRGLPRLERHPLPGRSVEKNVAATQLSMNVATIPPGGVAAAHIHVGFEVMLYILAGPRAARVRRGLEAGRREHRRRFHLHRARRAARGVQRQRHRARRRRRRALGRERVAEHRAVREGQAGQVGLTSPTRPLLRRVGRVLLVHQPLIHPADDVLEALDAMAGSPERDSSCVSRGKRTITVGIFRYLSARNIISPPSDGGVR